ncbi:hypothetical protein EV424DRAFT_1474236 [Suillus variegatus]|nr:hypothetical protein EV424DRAFT_1474236 [Suillus variegatus]
MLRKSGLTGFKAKEMVYCIVVTMFADDTTVYLTENGKFSAKFNTEDTEIIPIGSKEYRENILVTCKIKDSQECLPDNIEIAKDGKAMRILGVWVGNDTDEHAIWSPILNKIKNALQRWEKWHPTIEGHKIIIQCTVGSMLQYLMTAQGMPKDIEDLLTK